MKIKKTEMGKVTIISTTENRVAKISTHPVGSGSAKIKIKNTVLNIANIKCVKLNFSKITVTFQ